MRSNFLALTAVLVISLGVQAEVVLVASTKSSVSKLSADEVQKIFSGAQNLKLKDKPIKPLLQTGSSRQEFFEVILHKDEPTMRSQWGRMMFAGNGAPPKSVPASADVKPMLAADPSFISFMDRSELDESLRVIFP